jgi:hypothetical protein
MIDIECLAQSSDAVILTIGAICFDPYSNDIEDFQNQKIEKHNFTKFYRRVSIDSCTDAGLVISDDTVTWWSKQNQKAIDEAFSEDDREPLDKVLKELFTFSRHCTHFWAKSPQFDMSIIETAAKRLEFGVPWRYSQLRDVRTIEELTGLESRSSNDHRADEDALNQAKIVQKSYQKLGLTRPVWQD